jgi:hypothetical protein
MMAAASRAFADPAAAAARLLLRLALILLMVLTPVAELFFRGPLYVFLPVGACIVIVAGRVAQERSWGPMLAKLLRSPIAVAALFLFFWAGLSLLWTPFPDEAVTRFFKASLTALVVFFAILSLPEKTKPEDLYLLPIGLAITAVATMALTVFAPRMFWQGETPDATLAQRCVMTLTVLVWPAIGGLALREKWLLAVALVGLVTAAVLATFLEIALVGLALAAVVYAIAASEPKKVARILGFGLAALVLFAPAAALTVLALVSLAHLPHVGPGLVFADVIVQEWPRFITGHGLDFATRAVEVGVLPPDAPSSIVFKIWYELGVLGAVAFAVLAVSVFIAAGNAPVAIAPALLAGLVAGLVVAIWGTETTQIWWMSLSGLDAIALALMAKGMARAKRPLAPPAEEGPLGLDNEIDEIEV